MESVVYVASENWWGGSCFVISITGLSKMNTDDDIDNNSGGDYVTSNFLI